MNERDTQRLMTAFDWCLDTPQTVAVRRVQHRGGTLSNAKGRVIGRWELK